MADVTIGHGSTVSFKIGAAAAALLGQVTAIGLPNPQIADVEATHFQSPDRAREYIPGLKDNGEITIGINYDAGSATDTVVNDAMAETAPIEVTISIPTVSGTNQEFTFPGIVKGYEKAIPIDDRQTATITIRVAGAVTQAAAGA
ncbi:phage tail tube protein [Sphingobium fuliginis]|jgi:hypothetical protein|uniref:phage tail tube protein n=1 Tax=Sphingobium fuliginis (strain ATCC 27551) TaxID=336203 RepID=UPI0037CB965E